MRTIYNILAGRLKRDTSMQRHLFYAPPLALALMLGNIMFAQAQVAPLPPFTAAGSTTLPVVRPAAASAAGTGLSNAAPLLNLPTQISATDNDILAARDAFDKRDLKSLAVARDRVNNAVALSHPLSQYVQYWWLSANLADASGFAVSNAAEIRAFLNLHPQSVVADGLRREWLKILGRLDQWERFAAEINLVNTDDPEITCHHWRYRLIRQDRDALAEAKSFWNSARAAPDACMDVFARLAAEKMLPSADVWARVHRLLENNQLGDARKSAALIPNIAVNFERATTAIGQNPLQYLQREKLQPGSQMSVELFLFAVTRLARTDAAQAALILESRGDKLAPAELGYAWAQVGLYGGMQHDNGALAWFERAAAFPLNDTQANWKARAALRAGDWLRVQAAISAMSEAERRESVWRYWLARAAQETGGAEAARGLREVLAGENSFYGVLAAEELGLSHSPDWQGFKPSRADIGAVMQRPAIGRALAFYRLDMKNEGLREWQYGIRNMNDQELLAAAEAARLANVPDRAINTAEKTLMVHDFAQRFPTPHRSELGVQARAQGLDESWIYGLIRQESRFMADAKSRVGAVGLMQLMPATATWAAKRVSMDRFSLAKVSEVPVNLNLGSFYLRHVLDDLGHPVLATAGYNAGPGRARRWRAPLPLEGAIYAETIPFAETRDYVKKVMVNAWFYADQAGATRRRLKEMMGIVPGSSQGSIGISSLAGMALKNRLP